MLEDQGKKVEAQAKLFADARKRVSQGKLDKVQTGNFIVYALAGKRQECTIGKVTALSRAEATVIVHRYRPVTDNHLRLYWQPVYVEGGVEVIGEGSSPSTETVPIKRVLFPVQLHDGVLAHAAARRLDHLGYRYDRSINLDPNDVVADVAQGSQLYEPCLAPAVSASKELCLMSSDGESFCSKVEKFCLAGKALPSYQGNQTSHVVYFQGRSELQKWLCLGYVDFAELFRGFGEATIRVREAGCTAAEGFDKYAITYDRCWHLDNKGDQCDCAWLLVYSLRPKAVHLGTPCTDMCLIGQGKLNESTISQNEFTHAVAVHQVKEGLGCSIENPKGSLLFQQPLFVKTFGTIDEPKPGWSFFRLEGCQFRVIYPGKDDPGRPIQKAMVWLANYDLSALEARCRKPAALVGTSHDHRHARGGMYVECEGWRSVARYTGKYTAEMSTVFAKACQAFVAGVHRMRIKERPWTHLRAMADHSNIAKDRSPGNGGPERRSHGTRQFLLRSDDVCIDLNGDEHRASPLQLCEPSLAPAASAGLKGSLKPVDQTHKAEKIPEPASGDFSKGTETEAEARKRDDEHEKNVSLAEAWWSKKAKEKDWDCVVPDLSVYRYSGNEVKEDPRRTEDYRKRVVEGLGFGKGSKRDGLTEADMEACREVLSRKAGAFWIEGEPRTALRYLLHDTIPTGPPCRTPPHRLKGEEADWVDEQLQKDVITGQLLRGNSEWASPPFATKAFAEHRRQRKRRVVVDYRRVNARILRAIYFVRSADGVVSEVAGSMWLSLVDACKGFNQIANTRRAREMLAILARSGQYLPVCLTFGPTNGPEDFAFATDRVFAPGRGRLMRFCTKWQIYADDITIRSGRWLDGVYYTDEEYAERLRTAQKKESDARPLLEEAFKALGFDPEPLGAEKDGKQAKPKKRPATKAEKADDGLGAEAAADPSPRGTCASVCVLFFGSYFGSLVWLPP